MAYNWDIGGKLTPVTNQESRFSYGPSKYFTAPNKTIIWYGITDLGSIERPFLKQ